MHIHLEIYIPKGWLFSQRTQIRGKNLDFMKTSFQPVLMGMLSYLENCTNQPRILSSIFLICVHMETLEIECISKSIFDIWCKIPRNSEAMPPCLCYLLLAWSRSKIRWISWAASPAGRVVLLRGFQKKFKKKNLIAKIWRKNYNFKQHYCISTYLDEVNQDNHNFVTKLKILFSLLSG